MTMGILYLLLLLPVLAGLLALTLRKNVLLARLLALGAGGVNLALALMVSFRGIHAALPLALPGFEFEFSMAPGDLFLPAAAVVFLAALLVAAWDGRKTSGGLFSLCLYCSLALTNGVFLAGNLPLMLYFWVGLLCALFGMLLAGGPENSRVLTRGFAWSAAADLLLMLGVTVTAVLSHGGGLLTTTGPAALGYVCLLLGALGKAGIFPFHAWIPDAAKAAPAPFAVFLPLHLLLGGGLALRALTLYDNSGSWLRILLLILGLLSLTAGAVSALSHKNPRQTIACLNIACAGVLVLLLGFSAPSIAVTVFVCLAALGLSGLQLVFGSRQKQFNRLPKVRERVFLDPGPVMTPILDGYGRLASRIEDGVSWFYDRAVPAVTVYLGEGLSRMNNGNLPRYLALALAGLLLVGVVFAAVLLKGGV